MTSRDGLFFLCHEFHDLRRIIQSVGMMPPGGTFYDLDRTAVFPEAFGKKLTVISRRHNEIIRTVNQQNRNLRQFFRQVYRKARIQFHILVRKQMIRFPNQVETREGRRQHHDAEARHRE